MNYFKKNPHILTWISMGALIAIIGRHMELSLIEMVVFGAIFGLYSGSLIVTAKMEAQK